eukprot:gene11008-12256_t
MKSILLFVVLSIQLFSACGYLPTGKLYCQSVRLSSQLRYKLSQETLPASSTALPSTGKTDHHHLHHLTSSSQSAGSAIFNVLLDPQVSLGGGIAGMMIILINRLSCGDVVSDLQARADILGVMASSALLLHLLSKQDIAARERDIVSLLGYALPEPQCSDELLPYHQSRLRWLMNTLLQHTPVNSIWIVNERGEYMGGGGVLSMSPHRMAAVKVDAMPILSKALQQREEVYLPDLQILPGRIEFSYLPLNCQAVLILPLVEGGGAIVMGGRQAKALRLKDLRRIRSLVDIYSSTSLSTDA